MSQCNDAPDPFSMGTYRSARSRLPWLLQSPPLTPTPDNARRDFNANRTNLVIVGESASKIEPSAIDSNSGHASILVELRLPRELGFTTDRIQTERVFAAAYATILYSGLRLLAGERGVIANGTIVQASLACKRNLKEGHFMLTIDVRIHMPSVEKKVIDELVQITARSCPFFNAASNGSTAFLTLEH